MDELERHPMHTTNVSLTVSRHGAGLLGYLVSVLLLAVIAVLGWSVYANWSEDRDKDGEPDGFSPRVLDQEWWDVAFARHAQRVSRLPLKVARWTRSASFLVVGR